MELFTIQTGDAAMAVAHVFAQANIGDYDQFRASSLDGADGLLHDAVVGIGRFRLIVLLVWNTEKQDGLESQIVGPLRFVGHFREGQLENPRHARDRLPRGDPFADEKRENEIVNAEPCLANEIAEAGAPSQTPRPMNQFSHRPRLSVAPTGRKLAGRTS